MCGLVHRFATSHCMGLSSNAVHEMILIIKTKKYIVLLTFYYLLKIDFSLTCNSKKTKRTIGGKDQKALGFPGNDRGGIG